MPATLDITSGILTYTATTSAATNLTLSISGGNYVFTDSAETITLTGATGSWSGSGTNAVTGPTAGVTSVNIVGGNGDGIFNIQATSVATLVTGGTGNDTFNVGNAANTLAGIVANSLSLNGGLHDTTTKVTAAAGTQVAASVVIGDTLNLFDQGDTGDNAYILAGTAIRRNRSRVTSSTGIETFVLNTGTGNDTVTQTGGIAGSTHVVYNGNSQGGATPTSDTFWIQGTASGSVTEVNGGAGSDSFKIGNTTNSLNNIAGAISFDGGGNLSTTATAAAGTQVATIVGTGDTLTILDFGFTGGAT